MQDRHQGHSMKIHLSPTARHALFTLATLLFVHPLMFSQDSPSPPPSQIGAERATAPLELASLLPDAPSENWSSSRATGDPFPAAPVIAVGPAQLPKSESHPFWDRQNRVLFVAVGGTAAADFCVTRSNLANGGRELNPITRVFSGSTAGLATNFALETGGVIGVSYLFHKSGHHKLERLTSYVNIGGSASAVVYGLTHR
jgi:hypothetical protein